MNQLVNQAYLAAEEKVTGHFEDIAFVAELRTQLLRFAGNQIGDEHLAEDLVQEALMGAVKNIDRFQGRAAFRSWVFAILKNKLIDQYRKQARQPESDPFDEDFDERGHWQMDARPEPWQCPESGLKQQQFMQILELCLNKLPARQAQVFMMREYLGLTADEICEQADVTTSNLHVLLYRARMGLQKCLSSNWLETA